MLSTSQYGIEIIKSFEGFRQLPYICAGGKYTIGYGHVILPYESYESVSAEDAENILRRDLAHAEQAVMRNIDVKLTQNQFDALVSLVFNIGPAALQRSTLRQKINYNSCFDEITREFMRWVYAGGRVLAGLTKRRMHEANLYCVL